MKKIPAIHPVLRNALGVHEILRRLGVPASSIYVALDGGAVMVAAVPVDHDGYAVPAGAWKGTNAQFKRAWGRAVAWWNSEDEALRSAQERAWQEVRDKAADSGGLVAAIAYIAEHEWPRAEA